MSDSDPPKISLVVENSQADIDGQWAKQKLDRSLIELATNLMRVVRGAGRPDDIIDNCAGVLTAALEYQETTKRYPHSFEVASALRLEHEPIIDYQSFWAGRQLAIRDMISGSLQVAASTLIGQRLQIDQGKKEMDGAFREMERLREEQRQKRAAEEKAARAVLRKPKTAAQKKRTPKGR